LTIKEWADLFLERSKLERGPISLTNIRPKGPRLNALSKFSGIEPYFSTVYSRDIIATSNNGFLNE